MKYVWILVAVVLLVRIDLILSFFDKTQAKYEASKAVPLSSSEVVSETEIVSVENDLSLKSSPRKIFLSLILDFQSLPDQNFTMKALEILKANPGMFSEKLDTEFESRLYGLQSLLIQKNKLAQDFLLEMLKILKGENLEMLKHFLSYAIDVDMSDFLSFYSKSSDTNCMIMSYLGDRLPDEEKYNELAERLSVLDAYILSEKSLPHRPFAQSCQMVLKLAVDKLKPQEDPLEEPTPDPNFAPIGTTP